MSNLEMISILSKQWADIQDIKKIARCGRDKASNIRDNIRNNIIQNGMHLPDTKTKFVPMKYVIDYFSLDIDYISKLAEKEKMLIC